MAKSFLVIPLLRPIEANETDTASLNSYIQNIHSIDKTEQKNTYSLNRIEEDKKKYDMGTISDKFQDAAKQYPFSWTMPFTCYVFELNINSSTAKKMFDKNDIQNLQNHITRGYLINGVTKEQLVQTNLSELSSDAVYEFNPVKAEAEKTSTCCFPNLFSLFKRNNRSNTNYQTLEQSQPQDHNNVTVSNEPRLNIDYMYCEVELSNDSQQTANVIIRKISDTVKVEWGLHGEATFNLDSNLDFVDIAKQLVFNPDTRIVEARSTFQSSYGFNNSNN